MRKLVLALAVCVAAPSAAHAQATAPASAPAASTASEAAYTRPVRRSWTSDRRDFQVGDVLTILIDERTLASATSGDRALDARSRDASVALGQGLVPAISGQFQTRNDAQSDVRGQSTRQNQFRGEMSVRVVGVEPDGTLSVKGSKLLDVDENKQELTLKGFVRPEDVSADNLVESFRVANAQLVYTSTGDMNKPKGGIISRILGALWP
ncbi:MAG TPA: flagellar basal body L-ring protein FlgH [Longimicrobiaceae bacterium]|nr:flagellar basal body L-ring protein FlgH [Longimicrobiaceae bacterium]